MCILREIEEIVDQYLMGKYSSHEFLALISTEMREDFISLGSTNFKPANINFDSGSISFRTEKNPSRVEYLELHLSPKLDVTLSEMSKLWGEFKVVPVGPSRIRHNYAFPKVSTASYQYSGYIRAQLSAPVDTPDSKVVTIMIRRDPISNRLIIA
ncbi:hypothetical protein [Hahella chejuensis]|uniref:hypothetical protein n=1 Tax=Hahella chejuensis TaxID=158327 RepID=UPI0011D0F4FF|nr:hypothetical protein [Hahella chejuensis]